MEVVQISGNDNFVLLYDVRPMAEHLEKIETEIIGYYVQE